MLRVEMINEEGKKIKIRKEKYADVVWVFDGEKWFDFERLTVINAVRLFRGIGYEVVGA